MIKLAIFDLDGTLVDSIHDIAASANYVVQKYGRKPLPVEQFKDFIGDGLKAFIKGLAGDRHEDELHIKTCIQEFTTHYDTQLIKNTFFYPGAEAFLKEFKKHPERKIGIVTNKPEQQARIILRNLGFADDYFVEIYGGDTFEVKKPHPKPLLEMMKKCQIEPKHTVMIGDSQPDVGAALAAGTHFLAVSFGYNSKEKLVGHGAKKFFDHFSELHKMIDELL